MYAALVGTTRKSCLGLWARFTGSKSASVLLKIEQTPLETFQSSDFEKQPIWKCSSKSNSWGCCWLCRYPWRGWLVLSCWVHSFANQSASYVWHNHPLELGQSSAPSHTRAMGLRILRNGATDCQSPVTKETLPATRARLDRRPAGDSTRGARGIWALDHLSVNISGF